jgi:hypothetical protein
MEIRKSRGQITDSGLPPTPSLLGGRSVFGAVPTIGVDSPPVSGQLVREGSRLQHAYGGSGAVRSVLSTAGSANVASPLKNAYPGSGPRATWADLPREVSQALGDEILQLPVLPDSPKGPGLVPRPPAASAPGTSAFATVSGSGGVHGHSSSGGGAAGYSESSSAVAAPTTPTVLGEHPGVVAEEVASTSTSPWATPQPPPEVQAAAKREGSRAGSPLSVLVPAPQEATLVGGVG